MTKEGKKLATKGQKEKEKEKETIDRTGVLPMCLLFR